MEDRYESLKARYSSLNKKYLKLMESKGSEESVRHINLVSKRLGEMNQIMSSFELTYDPEELTRQLYYLVNAKSIAFLVTNSAASFTEVIQVVKDENEYILKYFEDRIYYGEWSTDSVLMNNMVLRDIVQCLVTGSKRLSPASNKLIKGDNSFVSPIIGPIGELRGLVVIDSDMSTVLDITMVETISRHLGLYLAMMQTVAVGSTKARELVQDNHCPKLLNARAFDLLDRELDGETVMYFDVDYFKKVNDKYGHIVGDKILSKIGYILYEIVEEYGGKGFRKGGDEYVAILPDDNNLESIINRLKKEISSVVWEEQNIMNGNPEKFNVSITLGAVTTSFNLDKALEISDSEMIKLKRSGGKGNYVIEKYSSTYIPVVAREDDASDRYT